MTYFPNNRCLSSRNYSFITLLFSLLYTFFYTCKECHKTESL